MQAQHGFAPAASPGMHERTNILVDDANFNPVGTIMFKKDKGVRDILIKFWLKLSAQLTGVQKIELNFHLLPWTGSSRPTNHYVHAVELDLNTPYHPTNSNWYVHNSYWRGFATDEIPMMLIVERRNDVSRQTPEVWHAQTVVRPVR